MKSAAFLLLAALALPQFQSDGFSIRFKDGRTTFRVGEPLDLELVYSLPGRGMWMNRVYGQGAENCLRVHLDPPVTERPKVNTFFDGVPGGVLGGNVGTPTITHLTLTDRYRFDRPGRYKLTIESRQLLKEFQRSNVLEFELLPRDPAWEAEVLARRDPKEIRALDTPASVELLASSLENGNDRPARDHDWFGLAGYHDRAFVLDALERQLVNPNRVMGPRFMELLAALHIAPRVEGAAEPTYDQYLEALREIAVRRATALQSVPGALVAEMRRDFERHAYEVDWLPTGLARAAKAFPAEATTAFLAMSEDVQRVVLAHSWQRFDDPAFLPLLRKLYAEPTAGNDVIRDLALRRLHQMVPGEARPLMLSELGRPRLRVSIGTLGLLPDAAFPELEARWLKQLRGSKADEDRRPAAERLERFGTGASASAVLDVYRRGGRGIKCRTRSALLAYLARVRPVVAQRLLTAAATGGYWDETCETALITQVAELHWSPVVEGAAVAALRDKDIGYLAEGLLNQHRSRHAPRSQDRQIDSIDPPRGVSISRYMDLEPGLRASLDGEFFTSLGDLEAKLRTLARGTRLHWTDRDPFGSLYNERWPPRERDELFERFRRIAAQHGVILQREITIKDSPETSCRPDRR